MPNLLKVKRISHVGFVNEGANPEADILIWKSRDKPTETPSTDESTLTKEGGARMKFDTETLSTDAQAAFADLQKQADKVTGLEEDLEQLQKDLEAATATPASTEPTEVVKGLDPAVQELFAKLQGEADEAKATTSELVEKLAMGELEGFAKDELGGLSGEVATQAGLLRSMQKSLEAEDFEKIKEMLKAAAATADAAKVLTEEIGKGTTEVVGGDAFTKVLAKAAELVKPGTALDTIQKATAHVLRTDAVLAKEYEAERKAEA